MQNYALQTLLERHGHSVTTLNYPVVGGYSGSTLRHLLSTCRRTLRKIQGDPNIVWIDIAKESKKRVELSHLQKRFIDKHLHLHTIQPPITLEQIERLFFDAFVVGSDQVWRPQYNRFIENLFLDFIDGMDVKRVSYAASFGTEKWELSALQTVQCATLAKQFDAISVRESSGVALCKNYLGVEATHVLDPTLMLDANDYLSLCSGEEHSKGDYIAAYILDYNMSTMKLLKDVSRQLNIPLQFIGRFTKSGYPSIESWIEGIAHAKYVITDSFHGTVFSTIFQKQFVTLGNVARGNSRFDSLFATLGISESRQCNDATKIMHLLQLPMDYYKINKKREENRKVSKQFLATAGL